MKIVLFFLIIFSAIHSSLLAGDGVTAKVVSVIDGNTIEVESIENGKQRVVLEGIDSPELGQDFGKDAKLFLQKMLLNKKVVLEYKGKDRVGNYIAIVMLGDEDPRVHLLKEGLAWTGEKNKNSDLEPYRTWAEKKERGLWKSETRVAPWVFRRQQSMAQPKSS